MFNLGEECGRGLDPIGFVEPHVVYYENTFVYSIGQQMFKDRHEVSTKMYFVELMILCLEECHESSVPRSETDLFNLIKSNSIEIMPSDIDGYDQNMLNYNRSCYLEEEINE
ncbi:hypothetical protein RF11_10096 [Thelohanellus kitauei]|uniref:Uncharacterized protein n=1 Tax=Thelohanellus kitauei TaxID=669202 RepID=A0A0C2IY95_THEKT|nr:hypothetical protein RF11_10096 [Thelohanellus kitauei]